MTFCAERCVANPLQKRPVCSSTQGLSFAADALILTTYYKILDNIYDDKFFKKIPSLLLYPIISAFRKKACINYPHLDITLAEQTKAQQEIEKQKSTSPDAAADATAVMLGTLFEATGSEENKKALYRFGYFMGKIIYYLDCAQDYEKDKKNNSYNIFVLNGSTKEEADTETKRLCNLNAGEMCLCYNLLKITNYKPILDNIIFLGIPKCINNAGKDIKKETTKQRI